MSRTTPADEQMPRLQIDLDKMLRFAQWLFTAEELAEIRRAVPPSAAESDDLCAA